MTTRRKAASTKSKSKSKSKSRATAAKSAKTKATPRATTDSRSAGEDSLPKRKSTSKPTSPQKRAPRSSATGRKRVHVFRQALLDESKRKAELTGDVTVFVATEDAVDAARGARRRVSQRSGCAREPLAQTHPSRALDSRSAVGTP